MKNRNPETIEKIKAIQAMIASGSSIKDACNHYKMATPSFYVVRKELENAPKKMNFVFGETNKDKAEKVKKLIAKGERITHACQKVGIKSSTYFSIVKRQESGHWPSKKKTKMLTLPVPEEIHIDLHGDKLALALNTIETMAKLIKELGGSR